MVAIVETASSDELTLGQLQEHARTQLAGYKLPRELIEVAKVQRMPSGKPDLRWARDLLQQIPRDNALLPSAERG